MLCFFVRSADDVLILFHWLILQAKINFLNSEIDFIEEFASNELMIGLGGCMLGHLKAAMENIRHSTLFELN